MGLLLLTIQACGPGTQPDFELDAREYWPLIQDSLKDPIAENASVIAFWSRRLAEDSTGVGELGPLGGAYEARFQLKGNIKDLIDARRLYELGTQISAHQGDQFVRNRARVDISLHRFNVAYRDLDSLMDARSDKRQTRLQLFDAAMELEELDRASELLVALEDPSDFNYLIRAAKWNDHRGDLGTAILYMEQAKELAEAKSSGPLMQWVYSNLATYYGHAGRLTDAYHLLLKTLELNPTHVQSIKALAWMEYAAAGNARAANDLLDHLEGFYQSPDLYWLRAEIHQWDGDARAANKAMAQFQQALEDPHFRHMYANPLTLVLIQDAPDEALNLAREQFELRPAAQQAALLGFVLMQQGAQTEALDLLERFDLLEASEPMVLYQALKIVQLSGGEMDPVLVAALKEARFELGPLRFQEVENW